jgi:hypothetical protein
MISKPFHVSLIMSDNSYRTRVATSVPGRCRNATTPNYLKLPRSGERPLFKTSYHGQFVWHWKVSDGRPACDGNHNSAHVSPSHERR